MVIKWLDYFDKEDSRHFLGRFPRFFRTRSKTMLLKMPTIKAKIFCSFFLPRNPKGFNRFAL
jgi:hypothetical protein